MRIGIDACLILGAKRGGGQYVYKLIENLIEIDKENQYVLFYRFMREAEQRKKVIESFSGPNVENKVFRIPGYFLDFFWNTFSFPPIDLMLGKLDLFHCPFSYNPPPISSKWIVTVHDLMWQRFPAHYTKEELNGYERTFNRIKREAALVLASSESTKKDLMDFINIPSSKIRVIYLGLGNEFYPITDKKLIIQRLQSFGIKRPYFLCVGGAHWNENSPHLIQAYSRIKEKESLRYQLVMVGKKDWFQKNLIITEIKKRGMEDGVVLTGYVSEEDLIYLYNGALCVIQPSLWEGFGLPVLEAMACGVPVIASNIPAFKEVTGGVSILVDPYNVEEISEAMERISSDSTLRQEMVSKGLDRAKLFSWEKTANQTLSAYKEAIKM